MNGIDVYLLYTITILVLVMIVWYFHYREHEIIKASNNRQMTLFVVLYAPLKHWSRGRTTCDAGCGNYQWWKHVYNCYLVRYQTAQTAFVLCFHPRSTNSCVSIAIYPRLYHTCRFRRKDVLPHHYIVGSFHLFAVTLWTHFSHTNRRSLARWETALLYVCTLCVCCFTSYVLHLYYTTILSTYLETFCTFAYSSWWSHQMETFSALLAICAVTLSFDIFFDIRLNKRLSKQTWGCRFETQSGSLWRHCNELDQQWINDVDM